MTQPPGINLPGILYLGNVATEKISIGRDDALLVDNTTDPPTVSINCQQTTTTLEGNLSGLWGAPVPATVILTRNGRLCTVTTKTATNEITISDVRSFTFSPAIPVAFRPAIAQNCMIQIWTESGFAVEAAIGQMRVTPS